MIEILWDLSTSALKSGETQVRNAKWCIYRYTFMLEFVQSICKIQEVRTEGILTSDVSHAFIKIFLQGGAVYAKQSFSPSSVINTHYLQFKELLQLSKSLLL